MQSIGSESLAAEPSIATRPNVIVIFTDDQGYQDLGCYGSEKIRTPHLDQMASEGMRLTSFYAQPVCGVSRAALMTGCYPIRVAEPGNIKRLHTVLHPREWTMAEMFREAGYATSIIGKWHLGLRGDGIAGFNADTMPLSQGYDEFYGTPLFNGATVFVKDSPFRSPILRNQEVELKAVQDWNSITSDYTREAIDWIERNKDRPFFLYLAHNMPHIPLGASEAFRGKSAYGPYGDAIEEIDWSCGEILKKLKSLGIDEKTLVVYTSDNGPWIETTQAMNPRGKPFIPRDHSGTADPLRGYKMSAWEGGSRVPCIIRWPGTVPANVVTDELLTTMDLLPTFAKFANVEIPVSITLDGYDASQFLTGLSSASPRDEYLYYAGCLLTGVRVKDWKLVLPRSANPRGTGWWGRMIDAVRSVQLFDLKNDPGETTDIAQTHPEVVEELMQRIEQARQELGDLKQTGAGARLFDAGPRKVEPLVPRVDSSKSKPNDNIGYDNAPKVGNLSFTFEDGDLQGWNVVEGMLTESLTDRIDLPNHKSRPFNKQGNWFLFTGNQKSDPIGNDQLTGVITSPPFKLRGHQMSFLIGGGSSPQTYIALVNDDGMELLKAHGTNSPVMKRVTWNVDKFKGMTLLLKIVDRSKGAWGHITFDDFSCDAELLLSAKDESGLPR